jgi:hypothetical protein
MSSDEFKQALAARGLNQTSFARLLVMCSKRGRKVSKNTVPRWASGEVVVPLPVEAFFFAWDHMPSRVRKRLLRELRSTTGGPARP